MRLSFPLFLLLPFSTILHAPGHTRSRAERSVRLMPHRKAAPHFRSVHILVIAVSLPPRTNVPLRFSRFVNYFTSIDTNDSEGTQLESQTWDTFLEELGWKDMHPISRRSCFVPRHFYAQNFSLISISSSPTRRGNNFRVSARVSLSLQNGAISVACTRACKRAIRGAAIPA